METALRNLPVQEPSAPEGLVQVGGEWFYSEHGASGGVRNVGGTSASWPMWAGRAAADGVQVNAVYVYGNAITYRDITVGNNGATCLTGFDLCSGRGSWTGATP